MEIDIQLTAAPFPWRCPPPSGASHGAWVEFRGIVRGEEKGAPIAALDYEAYVPMAEREMRRIIEEIAQRQPCLAVHVIHRIGTVLAGEPAVYVGIAGRHRMEAFAFLDEFMVRLKQDVPIWKQRALTSAQLRKAKLGRTEGGAPTGRRSRPATTRGVPKAAPPAAAAEVLALLRQLCRPLKPERVPLADALGRVLRKTARAPEDQPAFDRSSVDGYAVRLVDSTSAFRIVDEIRAGDWKPRALRQGQAVRIATGAAAPSEDLRVVMKEDAEVRGDTLTLLRREAHRNLRFRGEDARLGQELIAAGTVLQPGSLALLASLGCAEPLVTRLPRVLHLATGNELVSPDQKPGRGQIRDSNSTLVRAFLAPRGIAPLQRRVTEDQASVKAELDRARLEFDLLLISGGASVGDHDFTRGLLEEAGFAIHVSKTTARPGKPLIVARRGRTLAFGLPGNPLAHYVCLNLFVSTALDAWAGRPDPGLFHTGTLAADLTGADPARETFWPAEWRLEQGQVALTPLPWRSSGDLTSLAKANALIRVAPGTKGLARGCQIEFARAERIA
ncbi:MAG: molybdenum cofactor biosynthesis protein MoaE [Verrucomicrobia bacterium]|nr:molybdenum cofactor biosynthesis protein MoaE [Verrucomicrobiota bacterium]